MLQPCQEKIQLSSLGYLHQKMQAYLAHALQICRYAVLSLTYKFQHPPFQPITYTRQLYTVNHVSRAISLTRLFADTFFLFFRLGFFCRQWRAIVTLLTWFLAKRPLHHNDMFSPRYTKFHHSWISEPVLIHSLVPLFMYTTAKSSLLDTYSLPNCVKISFFKAIGVEIWLLLRI